MKTKMTTLFACLILSSTLGVFAYDGEDDRATQWKAGAASVKITPQRRLHMAGYASRKEPAEGTEQDLFAKALAIEDANGKRVVFVTLDLIGVIEQLRTTVAEQVEQQFDISPQAFLMNASHTHCGPAYGRDDAKDYFDTPQKSLVDLVGQRYSADVQSQGFVVETGSHSA